MCLQLQHALVLAAFEVYKLQHAFVLAAFEAYMIKMLETEHHSLIIIKGFVLSCRFVTVDAGVAEGVSQAHDGQDCIRTCSYAKPDKTILTRYNGKKQMLTHTHSRSCNLSTFFRVQLDLISQTESKSSSHDAGQFGGGGWDGVFSYICIGVHI